MQCQPLHQGKTSRTSHYRLASGPVCSSCPPLLTPWPHWPLAVLHALQVFPDSEALHLLFPCLKFFSLRGSMAPSLLTCTPYHTANITPHIPRHPFLCSTLLLRASLPPDTVPCALVPCLPLPLGCELCDGRGCVFLMLHSGTPLVVWSLGYAQRLVA